MWNSWNSLENLVVPPITKELPGLPQHHDDDNPSPAKKQKMSKDLEDFSLPPDMLKAYAAESARLQAMQLDVLPYLPPGQCPSEPENDRRMYVPSLSKSLTRRDIFTYFCAFGDLEQVCVKNGVDSLNYAIVIFLRTASMHLAIAANPHSIKGHRLLCRKAAEKSPGKAIQSTKPGNPKKQPRKSDLGESKKRLGNFKNVKTKLKDNLLEPKKSVVPRKGDQTYVYTTTASEPNSRWSFTLGKGYTTSEEKEALKKGLPGAAKTLLEARAPGSQNSSTKPVNFIKPTTPLKTQDRRNYPSSNLEPIANSPRIPGSGPVLSARQAHVIIPKPNLVPVCTYKEISSIPKAKPAPSVLPPPINQELPKAKSKVLKGISDNFYFGPDFRYEHHCYTNVVAYEKTKLYIDLEPGESEKRKTIKEFIDEKYGVDIKQN